MTAPPPAGTQPGQYDLTSLMNLLRGLSPLNAGAGSDELNRAYLAAQAQQNAALLGQTTQLMSQDQTNRMRMIELMGAQASPDASHPATMTDAAQRWRSELEAQQRIQDTRLRQEYAQTLGYALDANGNPTALQTVGGRQQTLAEQTAAQQNIQRMYELMGYGPEGRTTLAREQFLDTQQQQYARNALQLQMAREQQTATAALQSGQQGWQSGESAAERALRLQMQGAQYGQETSERLGTQQFQAGESQQERNLRERLQSGQLNQQESEFARTYLLQQQESRRQQAALGGYMDNGQLTEQARAARAGETTQRAQLAAQLLNSPKDVFKAGAFFRNLGGNNPASMGLGGGGIMGFNSASSRAALPGTLSPEDVYSQMGADPNALPGATVPPAPAAPGATQAVAQGAAAGAGGGVDVTGGAVAAPSPAAAASPTPPAEEPPVPGTTPGGPVDKTVDRQLKGLGMEQWLRSMQQGAQGAQKASPRSRWARASQSRAKGGDAAQRDAAGTARTAALLARAQQAPNPMVMGGGNQAQLAAQSALQQQQLQAQMGLPPMMPPAAGATGGMAGGNMAAAPGGEQAARMAALQQLQPQAAMPQMPAAGGMLDSWRMALGQQPTNLPQTDSTSMLDGWRTAMGQPSAGVPETGGGTSAGDFLRQQETAGGGAGATAGAGDQRSLRAQDVATALAAGQSPGQGQGQGQGQNGAATAAPGGMAGGNMAATTGVGADAVRTAQTQGPEPKTGTSPAGPVDTAIDTQLGDLGMAAGGNFTGRAPAASGTAGGSIPYIDPRVFSEPAIQKMTRELRRLGRSDRAAMPTGGRRGPSGPGGPVGRAEQRAGTKAPLVEVGPYRFGEQTAQARRNADERFLRGTALINQRTRAGMGPGGPVSSPQWPSGAEAAAPMPQLQDPGSLGGSSFQTQAAQPAAPAAQPGIGSLDPFQQDYALSTAAQVAQGGVGQLGPQALEQMSKTQRGTFEGALAALGLNPDDFAQAYAQTRFSNVGNALSA